MSAAGTAQSILVERAERRAAARLRRDGRHVLVCLRQDRDLVDLVDAAAAGRGETLDEFVAAALRAAVLA